MPLAMKAFVAEKQLMNLKVYKIQSRQCFLMPIHFSSYCLDQTFFKYDFL